MIAAVANCPVCGDELDSVIEKGKCPSCGAPPRTRSLSPLLSDVISPMLNGAGINEMPLLAVAMTKSEELLLRSYFSSFVSISLYGVYGANHQSGVDVRDLSRYADGSFAGAFASLLFDYFEEHEDALCEFYRVLATGGVLFTHIAHHRLLDGHEPPALHKVIKSRPGYFEYLPDGTSLPSAKVGRQWLVDALGRAGFEARLIQVVDRSTGELLDWFIGKKAPTSAAVMPYAEMASKDQESEKVSKKQGKKPKKSATLPIFVPITGQLPESNVKSISTPVDPRFGFELVSVTLTLPKFSPQVKGVEFAEHPHDRRSGLSSESVIALSPNGIVLSRDLGENWEFCETKGITPNGLRNSFTLADGCHLIQTTHIGDDFTEPLEILKFDPDWRVVDRSSVSMSPWHGPRSIDEQGGVVIFAEYPANPGRSRRVKGHRNTASAEQLRSSGVYRSTDGGMSWDIVMELPPTEIRHFHSVTADPFEHGTWWLSSGDWPTECRVWRSEDNGSSWKDVTGFPDSLTWSQGETPGQLAFRFTDLVVRAESLMWGTDDYLGKLEENPQEQGRLTGSRIFVAARDTELHPRSVAYVGNPVRSIIDVGQCYVVATEAKRNTVHSRPQVFLLSKSDPALCAEIATIDRYSTVATGFTYSRASRIARNGRFFTSRGKNDVFEGGSRLLQWDIAFR